MIYVDGIAALWFLRHHREDVPFLDRCDFLNCPQRVSEISERGLAAYGLADKPLQLAVHKDSERICTSRFGYRVYSLGLPRNAFLRISDEVAIASPELCFAEFSSCLSVPELIVLGFELTGSYCFLPHGNSGFTPNQAALCSVESLKSFIERMPRVSGLPRAREALRWVADASASPRETELGLKLYLPSMLGGYKLNGVEFNGEVFINKTSAERIGIDSFHCDLLYRSENIALEYQSNEHHLDKRSYMQDMQRMNAIQAAGTRIINVTSGHLKNYQELDLVARDLSRALGRRFRKPTPEQFMRKIDLGRALERAERVIKTASSMSDGHWDFNAIAANRGNFSSTKWLDDYLLAPAPKNLIR